MTLHEIPLPGLDIETGQSRTARTTARAYSNTIAPTDTAVAAFHSKIVTTPGCLIFCGAISDPDGYGRMTWRSGGVSRTMSAHRFALTLAFGELPVGTVAEHRCNEPLCVRVDAGHVICSTQSASLAYAVACGRAIGPRPGPGDGRTRVERSRGVRDALRHGWNEAAYRRAAGLHPREPEPTLF